MRHRHLALVACVVVAGSVAHASPARHRGKAARKAVKAKQVERVAFAAPDDQDEAVEADPPVRLHRLATPPAKAWHVAIGPYLWASAVDANVSLGPTSIGSGVDFIQLEHHAKYGAEVLGEAHYGRFSLSGDFMYGVVAVDGGTSVGPLMVTLAGEASSLLVDGAAGYRIVGDDQSLLALEARAGIRYQRTSVAGSLGVSGTAVTPPEQVDSGADALAGGHVVVRPFRRLFASSTFDIGVFGASTSTWSLAADASVQITAHLLLSVGWRTLTMERAHVDIVMHGPRAALQLTF